MSRCCFTLLELLVATTVLAVLMPAVMLTFSTGIKAYRYCNDYDTVLDDSRGAMMLLESDIKSAVPVELKKNVYTKVKLSFITQHSQTFRLQRVTYNFEGLSISREVIPFDSGGGAKYYSSKVLNGLKIFQFHYKSKGIIHERLPAGKFPDSVRLNYNMEQGVATESRVVEFMFPLIKTGSEIESP